MGIVGDGAGSFVEVIKRECVAVGLVFGGPVDCPIGIGKIGEQPLFNQQLIDVGIDSGVTLADG